MANKKAIKEEFKRRFPLGLFDEDLKKYCTFFVGGKTDYFYVLKNIKNLPKLVQFAKEQKIPYLILGKGSNILFDDKGFRGLVIKNEAEKILVKDNEITADSGVNVSTLVGFAARYGLSGLEKWIGLPGTVGGLVRGNAGCNGLETKDILMGAILLDPETGKSKKVPNRYFKFGYRNSVIKKTGEIVLHATFKLKKEKLPKAELDKIMAEINRIRLGKQPYGASAGSFFKNPSPSSPAGMLIDKVGLKGKKIGGAQISQKHGNFILNLGNAKSQDIKKLAKFARSKVKQKFGIILQEEVQIMSEFGPAKLA
ncbi:MAG: UDP-N-acetylmuramate dehydrogenase [Candidatus Gracilibacteria bacterium]|jgi:UDP-N-acetylmuramate dehydrogenase